MTRTAKAPQRIAFVGGSSIYGQGDPSGGGFVGRFRATFEPKSELHRVYNLGVGGDTVPMMLARAPLEVRARRADLIFCYPGLNDSRRIGSASAGTLDLKHFTSNLEALITALSEVAPTVLMTSIPIDEEKTLPYRTDMYFVEADAQTLTEIVRETAQRLRIPCFDIYASLIALPARKTLLADGLHANAEGHSLVAQKLLAFYEEHFCKQ